jgi:hypothetical protein
MYHITINIHNIHPILDGSMALHVIHKTEQQLLVFMNNSFATNIVQWARVYETLKQILKVNPEVMY